MKSPNEYHLKLVAPSLETKLSSSNWFFWEGTPLEEEQEEVLRQSREQQPSVSSGCILQLDYKSIDQIVSAIICSEIRINFCCAA